MKNGKIFSDEIINKYLDGELDSSAEKVIIMASLDDLELRTHIRELRQVRALVRQALAVESPSKTTISKIFFQRRIVLSGVAASLLMILGGLISWGLQPTFSPHSVQAFIGPDSIKTVPQLVSDHQSHDGRAILHINSADTKSMNVALDKAENMLAMYRNAGRVLRLEILVNAGGLKHFREDTTPFLERLASMQEDYGNLELLACKKTIAKLKRERRIEAKLVPGVKVVPSALDRILSRLNDGWSYIRV